MCRAVTEDAVAGRSCSRLCVDLFFIACCFGKKVVPPNCCGAAGECFPEWLMRNKERRCKKSKAMDGAHGSSVVGED